MLLLVQWKCDQYWPSRGSELYGWIEVTLVDIMELATYTIRTFHLAKVSLFILLFFFSVCVCPYYSLSFSVYQSVIIVTVHC